MSTTPRLSLPHVVQSQSQKEVTHNEALNHLDAVVQPLVQDRDLASPPASPAEGQMWIVAAGASGDWAGQDSNLAQFIGGAWWFLTPPEGFTAWLKDEDMPVRWTGTAWEAGKLVGAGVYINGTQVIAGQQPAISDASGGTTIDTEARTAINALLAACRAHGLIAP